MNLATFILLAAIVVCLIFAVRYVLKNGTCGGCPGSKRCHASGTQAGTACGGNCASCHGCPSSSLPPESAAGRR